MTQNQTRQFYVVNDADMISVDSKNGCKYIEYKRSATEPVQRTDIVNGGMNSIVTVNKMSYLDQRRTSKASYVMLKDSALKDGHIINGQDYMLNINIKQYYFKSDLYDAWKHGIVHGAGNMSPSDFYVKMAYSLALNFSREPWPILKFYVGVDEFNEGGSNNDELDSTKLTEITKDTNIRSLLGKTDSDAYVAIVIDEAEQDWHLGKMEQEPVLYDAFCDYIMYSGEDMLWGDVDTIPGCLVIKNGKKVADMEWFYHGERGDIYREYAYPNNFDNVGIADPDEEYDIIEIHYYWQGANHAVQKSEKDITIAVKASEYTEVADKFTSAGLKIA